MILYALQDNSVRRAEACWYIFLIVRQRVGGCKTLLFTIIILYIILPTGTEREQAMADAYLKTNYHTHTTFCDGRDSAEENVRAAIKKGFAHVGFSAHSLYPFSLAGNLNHTEHTAYVDEIRRLQRAYAGDIAVHVGFESDYIPGICAPRFDAYAAFAPEFLIGSVHFVYDGKALFAVDHTPQILLDAVRTVYQGDARRLVGAYFAAERAMLADGDFTVIGHADLIRKFNGSLRLFDERDEWYKREVQETVRAIARAGVIAEINTGAISRGHMTDPYPSDYMLSLLKEKNVPVMINADAHTADALDCAFDDARARAKNAGYTETAYLADGAVRFCAL